MAKKKKYREDQERKLVSFNFNYSGKNTQKKVQDEQKSDTKAIFIGLFL